MQLTVMQTLPALNVGGVERGTLEVAEELVKRGHRCIVVSAGGALVKELQDMGSEHITLSIGKKSPLTLRHIPKLRQLIKQHGVNVLHARSRLPGWISYLAWRGMQHKQRPRFVTSVHGPYTVGPYSKVMTYGECVIAISDFIHNYILTNYPQTNPDKITVIPRGVSNEKYPYGYQPDGEWLAQWQQQQPQLRGKFLITLAARITRWKGQEDFILIIDALKSAGINVHGLIVGGPPPKRQTFYQELKNKVSAMELDNHISFLGHRNDVREIVSISGLLLSLAKEPEAFGRTALEALSLGIPVIAYDHGGAAEILRAILPAGLIAPHDISAAINLISRFHHHMPVVPDQNPFTLQRMLDRTLDLYEMMVAGDQP